jgi:UDP-N-acetylmuramoyl-tripeptide--D-alanyl-D-alanine ligase
VIKRSLRNRIRKALIRRHARLLYVLAYVWRRLLFRTTFIAVTGSVGKTTTKELTAAILATHFPTTKTLYTRNDLLGVPRTILRVRPWHRFAVVEIATDRPGMMSRLARLVRPDVAVVLAVARTHTNNFSTLEDTAAEKARILEALGREGLAILNADDPRVQNMAVGRRCRVKTFGRSARLDLWADSVSSKWPSRLTLQVHMESETQLVKTSLVGEHWANSVLAALLVARSCGIPLKAAASALEHVKPFMARMQPVLLPSGATVIRDELNGSPDALQAALEVWKECDTARRVLVMGDVSDSPKKPRVRFRELGKMAPQVADLAIFIGEHGHHAVKAAVGSGMKPECALSFMDLSRAAIYLKSELRVGDLVLLKGRTTNHLSRLFFAQFGDIGCWKTRCRKTIACDLCEQLRPEFDLKTALG